MRKCIRELKPVIEGPSSKMSRENAIDRYKLIRAASASGSHHLSFH